MGHAQWERKIPAAIEEAATLTVKIGRSQAAISEMREPRAGFLRVVTGDFLFAARRREPVRIDDEDTDLGEIQWTRSRAGLPM